MKLGLFGALLLAGCSIPRNESPVSFGVPDGMVLGRDVVVANAEMRAEVVTFACGDQRAKAYVLTPLSAGRKPAQIRFRSEPLAWPKIPDLAVVSVFVAERGDLPNLKEAAKAMTRSFDEVDPLTVESRSDLR